MFQLKRAYEPTALTDGRRIRVDRLWPRGLSKKRVAIGARGPNELVARVCTDVEARATSSDCARSRHASEISARACYARRTSQ